MENIFGEMTNNMRDDSAYFQELIKILYDGKIKDVVLMVNTVTGSVMEFDFIKNKAVRYSPGFNI